jgi:hypothetical protein
MGTYRPNVTDKEQGDIEAAADDSAIRIQWFDGKEEQQGETKLVKAYDNQNSTNANGSPNDTVSSLNGSTIGSHNDKPSVFQTPGKA